MRNKFIVLSLLIMLFVSGCSANNNNKDIFQYKGSYVGDNSAVGNITNQLRSSEHLKGIELKTKEKPYGIILNYDWLASDGAYKETTIFNATFLFTLVQNADWISFNFGSQLYHLTRENLQEWYGKNLSKMNNEDELRTLLEHYLNDENRIDQLFE